MFWKLHRYYLKCLAVCHLCEHLSCFVWNERTCANYEQLSLVEKRAVLPVLNPLQSRFWNREHESGTKGSLL